MKDSEKLFSTPELVSIIFLFLLLYLSSMNSFVSFHTIVGLFGIIVASGIIMVTWNSRHLMDNTYLLYVGTSYILTAIIDILHILTYTELSSLPEYGLNINTQLWVLARSIQAISLLVAPFTFGRRGRFLTIFLAQMFVAGIGLGMIIVWNVFPICYVENVGPTLFKIYSEFIIVGTLIGSIFLLRRRQEFFDPDILRLLIAFIAAAIFSELALTFDVGVYGFSNLVGHFFKILEFYFIYRVMVRTGISDPYKVIFLNLVQSQEAYKESEERYRGITERSFDAIITLNLDGTVTYASPSIWRITDNSPEEVVGESFQTLFPESEASKLAEAFSQVVEGSVVEELQLVALCKQGSLASVELNISPILKGEEVVGVQTIIKDITERKHMEEVARKYADHLEEMVEERTAELRTSEEMYRDLFENANDMIQSVAPDGSLLYVNRAWLETLGYSEDEVSALSMFDIIHPDSHAQCMEEFQRIMAGEEVGRIETVFVTKEGGEVVVEGSINCRLKNDIPVATRGIFRDITERKRMDEMKSRFVSTATHELRTPLTSIKGYTELIRSSMIEEVSPEVEEMLAVVERNADRLIRITDDLLDQQRIESGKLQINPEPIKLQEIIAEAVEEIRLLVSKKDQVIQVNVLGDLPMLMGDRVRLSQVIINLLNNAVKFTPEDGEIILTIRSVGEMVEVEVSDTGTGVRAEDMSKLFTPFPDIERANTEASTGLGLSICKGIVELHGGKIWAESRGEGKGSTFTFTLPVLRRGE